jgi:hypothetical protein
MPDNLSKLDVLIEHIQLVQQSTVKLGKRLIERGEIQFGKELIARGFRHDNSKFYGIEFDYLNTPGALGPPDPLTTTAIDHHRRCNEHHPEYWGDIKTMPRIAIAEMVCDWRARSSHWSTGLVSWIKEKAMEQWGFNASDAVYGEIMYFVSLLLDQPFTTLPSGSKV